MFRFADLVGVFYYFFLKGALQSVGVGQQILHRTELADEFGCRFLADTRASRNIVRSVTLECEQIDYLPR